MYVCVLAFCLHSFVVYGVLLTSLFCLFVLSCLSSHCVVRLCFVLCSVFVVLSSHCLVWCFSVCYRLPFCDAMSVAFCLTKRALSFFGILFLCVSFSLFSVVGFCCAAYTLSCLSLFCGVCCIMRVLCVQTSSTCLFVLCLYSHRLAVFGLFCSFSVRRSLFDIHVCTNGGVLFLWTFAFLCVCC